MRGIVVWSWLVSIHDIMRCIRSSIRVRPRRLWWTAYALCASLCRLLRPSLSAELSFFVSYDFIYTTTVYYTTAVRCHYGRRRCRVLVTGRSLLMLSIVRSPIEFQLIDVIA